MNKLKIFEQIKKSGGRLTKIRRAIIEIFLEAGCIITVGEIIKQLSKLGLKPDRSTIYRELIFLTEQRIITKSWLAEKEYFELPNTHHHHLVCLGCKLIRKVELDHQLDTIETLIAKQNNFNNINHSLEFYGYCHNCQT